MWFSFAVIAIGSAPVGAPPPSAAAAGGSTASTSSSGSRAGNNGTSRPPSHSSGRTPRVCLRAEFNGAALCVSDASLCAFCLPLGPDAEAPKDRMASEEYTFTLTQGDGSRVQGFCRHFLPPPPPAVQQQQAPSSGGGTSGRPSSGSSASRMRPPAVLCLLCEASWAALFFKALEVVEQLLAQEGLPGVVATMPPQLPPASLASEFLGALAAQLAAHPPLGSVIRVPLPRRMPAALCVSPAKRAAAGPFAGAELPPLECSQEAIELQVPPDCGTGYTNAGVALARLLWSVPVPSMVTLIASLLLERRVILVAQSRDTVSAAVVAANALLYPLRWHHIYLPLLPKSLTDYLTAPMPFLVGLPAQLLPILKGIPMDAVTMIDLDLGKCEPAPGSTLDDARLLPWREMLEGALTAAFGMLRSPTEHESNPLISGIMQGYFLKLLGGYRSHIYPQGALPARLSPAPSPPPGAVAPGGSRRASSSLSRPSMPLLRGNGAGGDQQAALGPGDEAMRGSGYVFDHSGLVNSHRRSEKARALLRQLRQSQMYEVFVQERLKIAAACGYGKEEDGDEEGRDGAWDEGGDPFELRVSEHLQRRSERIAARLGAGPQSSLAKFQAFLRKQRRTDGASETNQPDVSRAHQLAAAFMGGGATTSGQRFGCGGPPGLASGGSWGNLQQLLMQQLEQPAAAGGGSGLRPRHVHSMSLDRIPLGGGWGAGMQPVPAAGMDAASSSTSASRAMSPAASIFSGVETAAASPGSAALQGLWGFDPAVFFEAEDEEVDAADAAAAAAAAQRGSGRLSRHGSNKSLSSLGGVSAGPSFTAGSGAAAAARVAAAAAEVATGAPASRVDPAGAAAAGEQPRAALGAAAAARGPAPAYPAAGYPSVAEVTAPAAKPGAGLMLPPPNRPPPAAGASKVQGAAAKPPQGAFAAAMRAVRLSSSSSAASPLQGLPAAAAALPGPPPPHQGLHQAQQRAVGAAAVVLHTAGSLLQAAADHHLTQGELELPGAGKVGAVSAARELGTVRSVDDPYAVLAARAPSNGGGNGHGRLQAS